MALHEAPLDIERWRKLPNCRCTNIRRREWSEETDGGSMKGIDRTHHPHQSENDRVAEGGKKPRGLRDWPDKHFTFFKVEVHLNT